MYLYDAARIAQHRTILISYRICAGNKMRISDILIRDKLFYKTVLMLALPIAAQQCITAGVNMVDTMMLGQLGETALAASSAGTQVHNLFHFMSMGIGMGAGVMVSRYLGSGERNSLRKTITLAFRACFIIASLYTLAVVLFTQQIMSFLAGDDHVVYEGIRYLRWSVPCYLLHGYTQLSTILLRSGRQMKIPLYSSIAAFFINIFANWVFIFGKLGAPALGVAGAALGTLISRIIECAFVAGYLLTKDESLSFRFSDVFKPCADLLPEYVKISIPVMISDTLLGIGNTMVVSIGGHIGRTYMAANSVTSVIRQFSSIFSQSLGQPAVIIMGIALGINDRERAFKEGFSLIALSLVSGALLGAITWISSPFLVGIYKIEAETAAVAMQLLHAMAVLMLFIIPASVLTKGIIRGGGDTRFLMIGDLIFLWCASIPLGYAAGIIWHLEPFWIFFLLYIDNMLKCLLCLWRFSTRKWMKIIKTAE